MKVYVLTTSDGGDNEIFCGVISSLENMPEKYYSVYEVEVDAPFSKAPWGDWLKQSFVTIEEEKLSKLL